VMAGAAEVDSANPSHVRVWVTDGSATGCAEAELSAVVRATSARTKPTKVRSGVERVAIRVAAKRGQTPF